VTCSAIGRSVTDVDGPCLILTPSGVEAIRAQSHDFPLMENTCQQIIADAETAINGTFDVPMPIDAGGGYTHEKHKNNALDLQNCGQAWQLTGNPIYKNHARKLLLAYADLYPTLGLHPARVNDSSGKLFWQVLNEAVWLVQVIQGYDCIASELSPEDRQLFKDRLFRSMVHFLTVDRVETFDRIHNHATWAAAAVGMCGITLGEELWLSQALYGTQQDGTAGFLKQVDELFSPDGYYAEGPYYQRYAILPFMVFALALDNNRGDLHIFERKEGVLLKAVSTLLQMSKEDGALFPINDAIKSKSITSPEIISALSIAWAKMDIKDAGLIEIARRQGRVLLSSEGLLLAKAAAAEVVKPFQKHSCVIVDGPEGKSGAVVILRGSNGQKTNGTKLEVVIKATSQGMGHGHFDRLSYLANAGDEEVIRDYGSARFVNVLQKHGGRYLPENGSWASQTLAHHALLMGEKSHFEGQWKVAQKYAPELIFAEIENQAVEAAVVLEDHAYPGWNMRRSLVRLEPDAGVAKGRVLLLDVMEANNRNGDEATADLPLPFAGDFIHANFDFETEPSLRALGDDNGYQHLWVTHRSRSPLPDPTAVTWMQQGKFYTWTTLPGNGAELVFTLLGAGDPEFSLRRESGLLLRLPSRKDHIVASVLEAHGQFDADTERVVGSAPVVQGLEIVHRDGSTLLMRIHLMGGECILVAMARDADSEKVHGVELAEQTLNWQGHLQVKYE